MAKKKKTGWPVIVLDLDGAHKVLAFDARSKPEALKFARMHGYDIRDGGRTVDIGPNTRTGHAKAWHVYVTRIHVTAKAVAATPRHVKPAREVTRIRENAPSAVKTKPAKKPKAKKPKKPKAKKPKAPKVKKPKASKKPKGKKAKR